MVDATKLCSNTTCERSAIEAWFDDGNGANPKTKERCEDEDLNHFEGCCRGACKKQGLSFNKDVTMVDRHGRRQSGLGLTDGTMIRFMGDDYNAEASFSG
ncbi:hypothetical protein JHK84_050805 [Glycine max]|nr:hypothetical protein JHK84_050805 [Glycine max]